MFRMLSVTITLAAIISMSGCVLGPAGGGGHCNSCDGYGNSGQYGMGPGQSFRQWRKNLTCGSGCGETYYDEWYSSPPDCEDPCPQFAGGGECGCGADCGGICLNGGCGSSCGNRCRGGFQPVRTIAGMAINLYGKRFCGSCGYDVGDCCCDGGHSGVEIHHGHSGGGCATGNCGGGAHHAHPQPTPAQSNVRRSAAHRQAIARRNASQSTQSGEPVRTANGQVLHPPEPTKKFYRQATRLPAGQPAFRR